MDYRPCAVCGGVGSEMHHIIRRSHCKAMVHAEINLIALCPKCHRHNIHGVHGKNKELDNKLKLELQNKLEMLFDKEFLTEDDINSVLKISDTALRGLLKPLKREKEGYERTTVIMQCMGGRLYEWYY